MWKGWLGMFAQIFSDMLTPTFLPKVNSIARCHGLACVTDALGTCGWSEWLSPDS